MHNESSLPWCGILCPGVREVQDKHFSEEKRFSFNLIAKRNASIFAMFMEKENPSSLFLFFILSNFEFYLMNGLVHVDNEKVLGSSFSINMKHFSRQLS